MISKIELLKTLVETETYIRFEKYRGYDPYDGLMSPLFTLPILNSNKILRWGFQQVFRRLPINLRPLLGIRKGYNPVTLALSLYAYSNLAKAIPERYSNFKKESLFLISELKKFDSRNYHPNKYSGAAWGYDFDWEAQYARIPRFTPTVVATGFVTNALFTAFQEFKFEEAFDLCLSATNFVRKDLNRTFLPDRSKEFCWSYSPYDKQAVLNATMKGARLLSQVYSVSGDKELIEEARHTVGYVMAAQHQSGAWSYSKGDTRVWSDNFHTGYVLDCLDDYRSYSGDQSISHAFHKGLEYYVTHFFDSDGAPKYYDANRFPIDATSAAQSLFTLVRFGYKKTALGVMDYMKRTMYSKKGYFYYQEKKWYKNRIPYMRWSTAWMFAAMSYLYRHIGD
ncbi:MAG: hypothetical protein SFU91_05680 [Chloroherpetonaceae bacterium]|nr:hypothetical protein [Chloroherpetonaceae bacterium]